MGLKRFLRGFKIVIKTIIKAFKPIDTEKEGFDFAYDGLKKNKFQITELHDFLYQSGINNEHDSGMLKGMKKYLEEEGKK